MWYGACPPQLIFARRRFRKVLLDPPSFEPGSWHGAGKLLLDPETGEYWLTGRPRMGPVKRGYGFEIYRSTDGENYSLVFSMGKEELSDYVGMTVQSIEGTQILRDPSTGRYMLYLSVDVAGENIAGRSNKVYESRWQTYLMTADDPAGPWRAEGFALECDMDYDSGEARDATIDIVDGRYFALYKARRAGEGKVNMALAMSGDGRNWVKLGVLKVDGNKQPEYFLLSGSIVAGCTGPVFIGTETLHVVKGAALTKHVSSYVIDYRRLNLETVFRAEWKPGSMYEHPEFPIHTYMSLTYSPDDGRWLMTVEAVDPQHSKEPGLNTEVDRLLLYVSEVS